MKILQVASSDITIAKLLLPLIDGLREQGHDVSSACADGRFAKQLSAQGYVIHTLPMSRSLSPARNLRAFWGLYRLMRRERFDAVHVHTPVAAAVGRLAARAAGVPLVVYTAHGFYFHDRMKPWAYRMTLGAERLLGRMTDFLFTQSAEDARTAVTERIAPVRGVLCIGNGVDVERFSPVESSADARRRFEIEDDELVVGFVGRLVREKGILDLLEAMRLASTRLSRLTLLVAGDNQTAGDRDQATQEVVRRYTEASNPPFRIVFTGFIDDIEVMMRAVDVFALPSYREGMPRSVIEAMATARPVVATNIRGCREEVIPGETGLLVEPGDAHGLSMALVKLLGSPDSARTMGQMGRRRAEALFDEKQVVLRQLDAYARLLGAEAPAPAAVAVEP